MTSEEFKMLTSALERIETSQTKQNERLRTIESTQVQHTAQLSEHMRRTDLNEKMILANTTSIKKEGIERAEQIAPVVQHVYQMAGIGKVIKWVGIGGTLSVLGLLLKLYLGL